MSDFVHLHCHSEYSLLDGACKISELCDRAIALGQKAIALTDHGVMYGAVDFYKTARAKGIKPIIGCEVYVAPRTRFDKQPHIDNKPYHLIMLCENNKGYENLIYLVSRGFTEGFYNKPRIDRDLMKGHTEGIIVLSGCLAGEVPRNLLAGDYAAAKKAAMWYRDTFGRDNYFLEVQNHGMDAQLKILPQMVKLSEELDIPLVATNDIHYPTREDSKVQRLLLCIQMGKTVNDELSLEFPSDDWYIKSSEDMAEIFKNMPSAIENTVKIADRCNVTFTFGETKLPLYNAPNGEDNYDFFVRLCKEGMYKRYGDNPSEEIKERLDYEISVVKKMGYVEYYLIVYDFINYAKSVGIPVGPGRGSGAGSIAAYCIGITGIDPMRYNLLFERFLNPERVSMPDFDIDFCYQRRPEVIEYVVRKYGADHVAQIVTFGTMAAKAAIRDVGRALGLSYGFVDKIAKLIPNELHITIDKAVNSVKELQELIASDEDAANLIALAKKVEGMPRHASTHAAGVVITRNTVDSYVPLATNDDAVVTQYTMTTLEELGLLKMDFLGLRNLTVIADCEKMIRRHTPDFSIENVPEDDKAVFDMLSAGDTGGVFQLESAGMRRMITQLKPSSIEDIIAAISLYRPGPMDSIPRYIECRHNPEKIKYSTPYLKDILDVTYGCIVYQEQVMQICRSLAGYSYGQADLVRRAMAKKKADVMEKERGHFIRGCGEKGISEKVANDIFDDMSTFAAYAFNKSHAAAYAVVAYRTAYLKCHYPREYMAALLTSILDSTASVIEYIGLCKDMGIKVLPPDINESYLGFTVCPEGIRFGLLAIKNLGAGVINAIIFEREKGPFKSFIDFYSRMFGSELNKRAIESLIKSGAMDSLGANRRSMLMGYAEVGDNLAEEVIWKSAGQTSLFGEQSEKTMKLPDLAEFDNANLLAMEKEVTGLYLSGHPMLKYAPYARRLGVVDIVRLLDSDTNAPYDNAEINIMGILESKKLKITKSNQNMAFAGVDDGTGLIECLIFPKIYEKFSTMLNVGESYLIKGRLSLRDEKEPNFIPESFMKMDDAVAALSEKAKKAAEKPPENSLYLKLKNRRDTVFYEALSILSTFKGDIPVFIYDESVKKVYRAPDAYKTDGCDLAVSELKKLLGEDSVKFK